MLPQSMCIDASLAPHLRQVSVGKNRAVRMFIIVQALCTQPVDGRLLFPNVSCKCTVPHCRFSWNTSLTVKWCPDLQLISPVVFLGHGALYA